MATKTATLFSSTNNHRLDIRYDDVAMTADRLSYVCPPGPPPRPDNLFVYWVIRGVAETHPVDRGAAAGNVTISPPLTVTTQTLTFRGGIVLDCFPVFIGLDAYGGSG